MLSAVETPGIPWPAPVRQIDDRCPIRKALVLSSASASNLHARWRWRERPSVPTIGPIGVHDPYDLINIDQLISCFTMALRTPINVIIRPRWPASEGRRSAPSRGPAQETDRLMASSAASPRVCLKMRDPKIQKKTMPDHDLTWFSRVKISWASKPCDSCLDSSFWWQMVSQTSHYHHTTCLWSSRKNGLLQTSSQPAVEGLVCCSQVCLFVIFGYLWCDMSRIPYAKWQTCSPPNIRALTLTYLVT